MPTATEDTFQELSILDHQYAEANTVLSYVLKKQDRPFDPTPLATALARVIEKWRLLAGRVEWDNKKKRFRVCVPTGKLSQPAFKFTTTTYNESINSPPLVEACIAPRPPSKFFSDSSTPFSLRRYASLGHPILALHVSHLNDATCIGLAYPHGVFDITGGGFIVKALNAELAGQEWVPPPLEPSNLVNTAFSGLVSSPDVTEKPATPLVDYPNTFLPLGLAIALKYLATLVYEYLFHQTVLKNVFLDKGVMDRMVSEVKGQVKAGGSERWVSTGDIAAAWFLKASLANDKGRQAICVAPAVSVRRLLSSMNSNFETSPLNCFVICPMPKFTSSWLHGATVAEVAFEHRKHIEAVRTQSFIQSLARYYSSLKGNTIASLRHFNEPSLILTNHVIAKLTDINFGPRTQLEAFWVLGGPFIPDGMVFFNEINGGYVISAALRKSRWDCIEKEIARIKNGGFFA